ncbi:MAG: Calx-beta domain-containing protein [Planctomycetaceae bacterium]
MNAVVGNVAATITIANDDARGSEPIVLQNAVDTYLTPVANPYSNLGGTPQLDFYATYVTYGGPTHRALLEFDLTSVSDVVSGTALLELYQLPAENYAGSDMIVEVYALTRDWEEGNGIDPWANSTAASWQNAGPNTPWTHLGGDFNTTSDFGHGPNGLVATATLSQENEGSWVGFDVTGAVTAWNSGALPNHGFIMLIKSGDYTMYPVASSEYSDTSLAPKLTIQPGDPPPVLPEISVATPTITVDEEAGTAVITVTLSESPTADVSVQYSTFNETAMAVSDFMGTSGTLTFAAGTTDLTRHISVPIVNDELEELTETFRLQLNGPVNAVLGTDTAIITILDTDEPYVPPTLTISDATIVEGARGTRTVKALVTLQNPPTTTVRVNYTTVDYTAVAGSDYQAKSGILTFRPGVTQRQISVSVIGDRNYETNERLRIQLSNAMNAEISDGSAFLTITNDDAMPAGALPFFDPQDLMTGYLGGFELPAGGDHGEFTFGGGYGGLGLALRPNAAGTASSLYVVGGNTYQSSFEGYSFDVSANAFVAEVSIPSDLTTDPHRMSMASVLSSVDLTGMLETNSLGQLGDVVFEGNGANYEIQIDDLLVVDGRLAVSAYVGYDVGLGATHSHFFIDELNLADVTDDDVVGLFDVTQGLTGQGFDGTDAGFVAGYMTDIPQEWQAALGGTHLMGQAAINGVLRTSVGPSAFAFDAASIGTAHFQTPEVLAYYPLAANEWLGEVPQPLAFTFPEHDGAPALIDDPLFNWNATVEDVTFVPGTRSVLFFGSIGVNEDTGESFVGYGDSPVYNDFARGHYKGPHSLNGDYEYQVWAYDVHDYIKVRNGEMAPWDVQPTNVWTFDFPGLIDHDPAKHLGGTAFDPVTNRLYVAQQRIGDALNGIPGQSPIIHVFQLGPAPQQTTASSTGSQAFVQAETPSTIGSPTLWTTNTDRDLASAQFQTTTLMQATLATEPLAADDTTTSEPPVITNDNAWDGVGLLAMAADTEGTQTDQLSTLLDEISLAGFIAG